MDGIEAVSAPLNAATRVMTGAGVRAAVDDAIDAGANLLGLRHSPSRALAELPRRVSAGPTARGPLVSEQARLPRHSRHM